MSKLIFILFLFFCSLQAFSQKGLPEGITKKSDISIRLIELEKDTAKVYVLKDKDIFILSEDSLCEILSIKVSDLLSESMLKKLSANV